MTNEFANHAVVVYVLTLLVTFHRVTTKFDLEPRLTRWATRRAAPRSANCCTKTRETLTTRLRSVVRGKRFVTTHGPLNHEPVSCLRIAKIGAHGQNLESRMPVRRVHASHRAVVMRPSQILREYR